MVSVGVDVPSVGVVLLSRCGLHYRVLVSGATLGRRDFSFKVRKCVKCAKLEACVAVVHSCPYLYMAHNIKQSLISNSTPI